MASGGMTGFFATHLHDIFSLPLEPSASDRIKHKRMVFTEDPNADDAYSGFEWTYKMEDGTCTQSHALVTAARFGLPAQILGRAVSTIFVRDCLFLHLLDQKKVGYLF